MIDCRRTFAALLTLAALTGVPGSSVGADLFAAATTAFAPDGPADPRIKRQRLVDVDVAVLTEALLPAQSDMAADRTERALRQGGRVTLRLFDDVTVDVTRSAVDEAFGGGVVWSGAAAGGGNAVLVVHHNRITGMVDLGRRHFLIEPRDGGLSHLVREIDRNAFARDRHIDIPKAKRKQAAGAAKTGRALKTEITLLATYTARARTMLGVNFADKINLDIGIVNLGLRNSGVPARIKPVGFKPVQAGYNERASGDPVQPLYDITDGASHNFPALRSQRDSLKADLVTLYADRPEYCGVAWVLYPTLAPDYAYSVINSACQGSVTLAHELGHNMGLFHDRFVEDAAPNSVYNYGYVDVQARFRTIMSYPNRCNAAGVSCTTVTYYSTPRRTFDNRPLGIAQGRKGAADAARLLDENRAGVADFR